MKALGHYLLLVGIPVLGILAVLHLGQSLTAPKAVAGVWTFEPTQRSATACAALADAAEAETLTITQSGPDLTLELGTLKADGQVSGNTVRTTSPQLVVEAAVGPSRLLRGTVSASSCLPGQALEFIAEPPQGERVRG